MYKCLVYVGHKVSEGAFGLLICGVWQVPTLDGSVFVSITSRLVQHCLLDLARVVVLVPERSVLVMGSLQGLGLWYTD